MKAEHIIIIKRQNQREEEEGRRGMRVKTRKRKKEKQIERKKKLKYNIHISIKRKGGVKTNRWYQPQIGNFIIMNIDLKSRCRLYFTPEEVSGIALRHTDVSLLLH